jgi:hypothetical protein
MKHHRVAKHLFGVVVDVVDVGLHEYHVVVGGVVVFALHQIALLSSEPLESLFYQSLGEAYWCQH